MNTAHPIDELLVLLGRRAVLELLWALREAPLRDPDDEAAERLEELRRNGLVAASASTGADAAWDLTPEGRALADQLFALATWAQRRGV
jgi:DNA-binding HxlR family transcriptional regulator